MTTSVFRFLSISAFIPLVVNNLPGGDTNLCNCSALSTTNNLVMETGTTVPFSGACQNEYRVEWISALKKKKMTGEMQAIVNGRKAVNHYSDGKLTRTVEKYSSGHPAAEYFFATLENNEPIYHGWAKQWHENGTSKYSGQFDMGRPIGEHIWLDSRGSRIESRKVTGEIGKSSVVEVEQTQWYDYQTKKSVSRFTAVWDGKSAMTDKKVVSYFSYHPNGKKKEITVYDSMSSGIVRQEFYDEKGNRIQAGSTLQMK